MFKVQTTNGREFIAKDIRPVKNAVSKGYRVENMVDGIKFIMFYREDEIMKIMEEQ
jgi:hypothetical protein